MSLYRFSLCLASLALAGLVLAQKQPGLTDSQVVASRKALQIATPEVRFELSGDRLSRVYGAPFAGGFTPEQAAASFLNKYTSVFDPGDSTLVYRRSQSLMNGKFTAVYYDQKAMGVPVDGGSLTLLVRNEVGSPVVLAVSNVKPVAIQRRMGQISSSRAVSAVRSKNPDLSVKNTPVIVAWQDGQTTRLAWTFLIGNSSKTDPKEFAAFVDSNSGQVLEMRNKVYFTNVSGHVDGMATPGLKPNQVNNPAALADLQDVRVRITGGNQSRTDVAGNYTITNPGSTQVAVTARLQGLWTDVLNDAGAPSVLSQNVLPPGPGNFTFNTVPAEATQSQVDAFIHVTGVHNFVKSVNSSYPGIDIAIPTSVNIASACNAFYSASTVNFFASGGGCPNTAYSTVIYHEYGHFVIDMGINNGPSGAYHEGMADTIAALGLDSPCGGEDFLGQDSGCLRSAYNSESYPCFDEAHTCGMVISGAFWLTKDEMDVTEGAVASLAIIRELAINSILLQPFNIDPSITIDILSLDDDDPFIWNGTPHYTEIATGFGAKNLDAPPVDTAYDTNGVSTIQGSYVSGGLAQITSSNNAYYIAQGALLNGLGYFAAVQTEFTIAEAANQVDSLGVTVEANVSPGNKSTGTVYFWNWNTSQFEYVNAFYVEAGTDTIHAARLTSNVSKYVNGSKQVRVAFRVHDPLRREGPRPTAFNMRVDAVRLFVGT